MTRTKPEARIEALKTENAALKAEIKRLAPRGRCGACNGDWEECGCLCEWSGFRRMVCPCCSWTRKPRSAQ